MRVLHGQRDFGLVETFALTAGGPLHLDLHLARLERSAQILGFAYDAAAIAALLERQIGAAVAKLPPSSAPDAFAWPLASHSGAGHGFARQEPPLLGRVELRRDGRLIFSTRPPTPAALPLRLGVDRPDPQPPAFVAAWRRHKTTNRADYTAARERHPGCDDVVLVNRAGLVTETTVANVAALIDGQWLTPPVSDGCLPGIGRQVALERGLLAEASITIEQLRAASKLAVISSAMGWRPATLAN